MSIILAKTIGCGGRVAQVLSDMLKMLDISGVQHCQRNGTESHCCPIEQVRCFMILGTA
ncbi:unnamed protein product [Rhodiola kirilowii]